MKLHRSLWTLLGLHCVAATKPKRRNLKLNGKSQLYRFDVQRIRERYALEASFVARELCSPPSGTPEASS